MRSARMRGLVLLGAVVALVVGCDPSPPPSPWLVEQISVDPSGTNGGDGDSRFGFRQDLDEPRPVSSADGSRVVFMSDSHNLVAGVTISNGDAGNPYSDVYVRDLTTGTTTLVSVAASGATNGDATSRSPSITADGTKVVFWSMASDLLPGGGAEGIYLRDLTAGVTTFVAPGDNPVMSPDGSRVAFTTTASDLGPPDSNGAQDVYLYDMATGTFTLVSVDPAGIAGQGQPPLDFSADSSALSFVGSPNLDPTMPSATTSLYVRDLITGTTRWVASSAYAHRGVDVDASGDRVAFVSAVALVEADQNIGIDVYVRDVTASSISLVSHTPDLANAVGDSYSPAFSPDGGRVLFRSGATNLDPIDGTSAIDVYVNDLVTHETSLVSINSAGTGGSDQHIDGAVWSPDGSHVAFITRGGSLHVRDLVHGITSVVWPYTAGLPAAFTPTGQLTFQTWGETVVGSLGKDHVLVATPIGADLEVTLAAERTEVVTFTSTVTNNGPDAAAAARLAVVVEDTVQVTSVVSTVGDCAPADPASGPDALVHVCDLGDLAVGESATVTVVADVLAPAGTPINATVLTGSEAIDPVGPGSSATASVAA